MTHKSLITLNKVLLVTSMCFSSLGYTANDPWQASYNLEKEGKYKEAYTVILKEKVGPTAHFATMRLAWLCYLQGEFSQSITLYREAIKQKPASVEAISAILAPLAAQGRWTTINSIVSLILDKDPHHYQAHIYRMRSLSLTRHWQSLKEAATRFSDFYPTQVDPWVFLARAELQLGNSMAAKAAYQQVIVRSPKNTEAINYLTSSTQTIQ